MKTLLISLLLLSLPAHADEWTTEDARREAAYLVLHTIDWAQTRTLAKAGWPEGHEEANAIMGKAPNTKQVDNYFVLTSAAHLLIARLLPQDWRIGWQYIAIGDATASVVNNHTIGVRIKF